MLPATVAVLRTIRPANRREDSTSEGAACAISGDRSRSVTVVPVILVMTFLSY